MQSEVLYGVIAGPEAHAVPFFMLFEIMGMYMVFDVYQETWNARRGFSSAPQKNGKRINAEDYSFAQAA